MPVASRLHTHFGRDILTSEMAATAAAIWITMEIMAIAVVIYRYTFKSSS
jgi:TRAP-type C4-dicarboxylate transport system permease small subunit